MYQKIQIIGNLGRDPEMRYLPNGQAVTNLSVAANHTYTGSNGEKVKETTWFRVAVWGGQAEACNQYLNQGSRVFVEGRIKPDPETGNPRLWTRNDGTIGANFEVNAQRVVFLSSQSEGQSNQLQHEDLTNHDFGTVDEDDIPF